jgi:hypothetical protein
MATRTIVTSQPDVECDVCERRLLRGEQPDIFLAAGRRRTVCELCAPRAAQEGWLRETSQPSVALPPMRPRRGRSLLERFRQGGRPAEADGGEIPVAEGEQAEVPYDLFDDSAEPAAGHRVTAEPARAAAAVSQPPVEPPRSQLILERALDVFNTGSYLRRVSGVARSLGAPVINVRSAEHHEEVVRIVVAWELCWYRYEVDLGDGSPAAVAAGQGTELSELDRDECVGNAIASESGAITLTP